MAWWYTVKRKYSRILWLIARWSIAVAAFSYLLNEGMFSSVNFSFSADFLPWLLCSLACALITVFGTAVRFHLVLRQLGQPSCLSRVAGMFFGGLLLLQIGSNFAFDGMRLVLLRKQGVAPAIIGTSVLADRLFGVSAIFLIAFFFAIGYSQNLGILFWPITGSLIFIAAIPAAFIVFRRFFGSFTEGWLFRIPGSRLAWGMGEALELLARRPLWMVSLQLFSFLPFLAQLFGAYCSSRALGIELFCGEAMAGSAFASLTAILPLPLSGVGVGENVFGWVVSMLRGGGEIVDYASVFFIGRVLTLVIGCVSWVVMTCIDSVAGRR